MIDLKGQEEELVLYCTWMHGYDTSATTSKTKVTGCSKRVTWVVKSSGMCGATTARPKAGDPSCLPRSRYCSSRPFSCTRWMPLLILLLSVHVMYICMVTHIARLWINLVRLPILHVVS